MFPRLFGSPAAVLGERLRREQETQSFSPGLAHTEFDGRLQYLIELAHDAFTSVLLLRFYVPLLLYGGAAAGRKLVRVGW